MSSHPPHLLVSLSPHGYGHAAMTAPMVEALRARRPDLRLTLQTSTPLDWLNGRYAQPFGLIAETPDFGMSMETAIRVRPEDSHRRYQALHSHLDEVVAAEAVRMRDGGFDLVLSNISYVALLAAQRAGIPALAMSCLNWYEIYGAYCRHLPGATAILEQMRQGYENARGFLCPAPSLPMSNLSNVRPIGPLARRGTPSRQLLQAATGRDEKTGEGTRIGLIAFGGMDVPMDFTRWPRLPGWKWVVCSDPQGHPDMIPREAVSLDFTDLLASCDLVIGKPGYGTFSEAAVNGVPMLYLPRDGWPETPYLSSWLAENGRALQIQQEDLFEKVRLENQLRTLFSLSHRPLPQPTGIEEGVSALLELLPAP